MGALSMKKHKTKSQTGKEKKFQDGYSNFVTQIGTNTANTASASQYTFNGLTDENIKLEAMYRTSWVVGSAVDMFAEDMTRAGINILGTIDPSRAKQIQTEMVVSGIWKSLLELLKWGRLYGGALAYIDIDGQDPATPLNIETIGKDQFNGLTVYDRWNITPQLTNTIKTGPDAGLPVYYFLGANLNTGDVENLMIHHTRVIRMIGNDLPIRQKITEQMWGQSIVERIYDVLISFDAATMGTTNLLDRAHLRVMKIDRLREVLAAGGAPQENLLKMFNSMRLLQTTEGLTLLDTNDEFQTSTYSFAGIPDTILQFAQQISGAIGIPLVKLFGQSPAGLNSTGESDFRMYYDSISAKQESVLRIGMMKTLQILHRSMFGDSPPDDFDFDFVPLWQTSEKEKAEISDLIVNQVSLAYEKDIISQEIALKELKKSSEYTGIFTTITDEDIEEARIAPPPLPDDSSGETSLEPKSSTFDKVDKFLNG